MSGESAAGKRFQMPLPLMTLIHKEKNMSDIFTSTPLPGAVLRDWTHRTLTVDIENSIGETYHFEVKPGESSKELPPASHSEKISVKAVMPIVKA